MVSGCSLTPIASRHSPASGSLISIESLVDSEGLHTQKDARVGRSSGFTFPLGVGRRRAADRLTVLRDGSIGPFALGDTWTSQARSAGPAGCYPKPFTGRALRMMLLFSAMSSRSGKTLDRLNDAGIFCVIPTVHLYFCCPSLGIRHCPVVAS